MLLQSALNHTGQCSALVGTVGSLPRSAKLKFVLVDAASFFFVRSIVFLGAARDVRDVRDVSGP